MTMFIVEERSCNVSVDCKYAELEVQAARHLAMDTVMAKVKSYGLCAEL